MRPSSVTTKIGRLSSVIIFNNSSSLYFLTLLLNKSGLPLWCTSKTCIRRLLIPLRSVDVARRISIKITSFKFLNIINHDIISVKQGRIIIGDKMDYLKVIISSIISLVVLFLLAKLIGNRQISQLTLFDYINGITIGSIAAEMATDLERHWSIPLLAMVIYGMATALISYVCCKSLKLRRFFNGKAIVVFENGKFSTEGLKKSRLDVNEFLTQSRVSGYFDLSEIKIAIMEQNGKLSFLPKSDYRPLTPKDMALTVPSAGITVTVVIDGIVLEQNLELTGLSKVQLLAEMSKAGAEDISSVMLATVDRNGVITLYKKETMTASRDPFL